MSLATAPGAVGGPPADVQPTDYAEPEKSATDTDNFCESFQFDKSVDNGGLAQAERLLQFARVLSRCM